MGLEEGKERSLAADPCAQRALIVFLSGLVLLLSLGNIPSLRTVYDFKEGMMVVKMSRMVSMVMLGIGVLIMTVYKVCT